MAHLNSSSKPLSGKCLEFCDSWVQGKSKRWVAAHLDQLLCGRLLISVFRPTSNPYVRYLSTLRLALLPRFGWKDRFLAQLQDFQPKFSILDLCSSHPSTYAICFLSSRNLLQSLTCSKLSSCSFSSPSLDFHLSNPPHWAGIQIFLPWLLLLPPSSLFAPFSLKLLLSALTGPLIPCKIFLFLDLISKSGFFFPGNS